MFARALLATVVFAACSSPAASPTGEAPTAVPSSDPSGQKRFDELDLALELESGTVRAGATLEGALVVVNRSGHEVVDPGCWLTASSAAIVPPDDPDAELWLQVVVDCEGPDSIHPGDRERHTLSFTAATKRGDPLPPGDYVAAVEYRGLTRRLEAPVTVTE